MTNGEKEGGFEPDEEEQRTYTPAMAETIEDPQARREREIYEYLFNRKFGRVADKSGLSKEVKEEQLQELRELAHELAKEQVRSETDHLTGLWRAEGLQNLFEAQLENMEGYDSDEVMVLVACDLDHFKQTNDKLGHGAADRVLQELGQAFRDNFRKTDIGGRPGGDEFVFIFTKTKENKVDELVERLQELIREIKKEENKNLTASLGVKVISKGDWLSYKDARQEADFASYVAKRNGRDRSVRANSDEARETEKDREWFYSMLKDESKRRIEELSDYPELVARFEETLQEQANIMFEGYKQ